MKEKTSTWGRKFKEDWVKKKIIGKKCKNKARKRNERKWCNDWEKKGERQYQTNKLWDVRLEI